MKKKHSVIIFTDLDGTLLNRDTFNFDEITSKYVNVHTKVMDEYDFEKKYINNSK